MEDFREFPKMMYHETYKDDPSDDSRYMVVQDADAEAALGKGWGLHPDGPFRQRRPRRVSNGNSDDSEETDPGLDADN